MLVLLLAGCAGGCASAGGRGHGTPAPPAAGRTSPAAIKVPRRPPAVTARVVLPSATMTAGSSMAAQVLVDNNTGHAIHVTGCLSLFQVLLTSSTYRPPVAWASCAQRLTVPAGHTRYQVTLRATYSECGQGSPQSGLKACLPGGHMPPLPPGTYHATLFQSPRLARVPPPVTVRVTRPGHR